MSFSSPLSGWHARTTAPPDQFFLDGRQLVFAVAVKAPDESAHILLAVIEPGQPFFPVPTGPFPVDNNRGVAIDEKGNLRTLSAEDYQGLTALAHGVDALQDPEIPGSTWRMGSSPEDQSTYELSVSVPGRLQGLSGNPVLRQTRVYAYGRENTKLTTQLPQALVEIFELAEEARVDGEPNEDMLGWVKNTLSSTSIPNLTPKQVANAVAAIRDATSGHAHIAPVINLEPKASYPPKETPRIPVHGMLGVRIPGAPDVPGRHAALDSLEPWSRPPNRRNWLALGGLGEVWISYPVARAGKKLTMSTVRAEYGRDADGKVIPWPKDATGVFYLDKDAPDATVRFRLTKTGEHAAFEEGEDLRGPDGERWGLRLHRPLQQGVVAKLPGITQDPRFAREEDMQPHTQDAPDATSTTHSPGTSSAPSSSTQSTSLLPTPATKLDISGLSPAFLQMPQHERHHNVIRLLYDRRGRLDARAMQNDISASTSGTSSSSTSRPSSSADANPSPPSDSPDPFPTSDSPPSAVPFRLPFPAGTLGYLYYHAHPEAPVLASGIRFRVVPDGKRWEEGWDLDSAMGLGEGGAVGGERGVGDEDAVGGGHAVGEGDAVGEEDAVGEGDASGKEGKVSRTRQSAEGHTPLVPWELTLAHAASFPGPWGQLVADGHLCWKAKDTASDLNELTVPAIPPPASLSDSSNLDSASTFATSSRPSHSSSPPSPASLLPALTHALRRPTPKYQIDRPAGLVRHLDEPFVLSIRPAARAWRFQDAVHPVVDATSSSAGGPLSTLDSASASVHREVGVGKVANGDEEDAATEDDDAALEDEGEADGVDNSATNTEGGSAGSIPRRHYVLTPHTTRVMVDLTFGAWPSGSTGKVLAKFEIADDGRSADGEPSRPVVLALRVLREIEPVVVPGVWEPTASDSTRLEGQIVWRVALDGPIPEATLLNMPRSVHVNAIFERARAAYFAQGLATKETKRQPGRPRKDGEDVVSARKERLTVEEFESKYPPIPRRGVCAPLDVAILNQQRAALRALALTKTQADLTMWFQGGPDNESHALKTSSYDPTPLLAHRIADWVDPKSGLVHNVQEPVETDVDFLSRPQVFPRGPVLHTQRAANRSGHDHLPLSRVDPLGIGLTAVSLVGRRRARGTVARLRRKTRAVTLRELATSEKALEHGPASSVPSIDRAAANGQKAQTPDADSEGREGVTRTRAERSAAWARVLAEYRARREQQEREKEERRNERKRRREEKREEEQEKRRLRQQKQREKELLKSKQAEEREARKQAQQEQARSAIAQRTRALDIQRLHLTRASQWLERAGAYLDEAEADASGDGGMSDRYRTPHAGFAATTSLTVAVARATVMIRQASRHLVRARLALRSSNCAAQRLHGPLERASCPVPPRARFVVSTLAADKITDLDRVDLGRIGQRKREAFIEWERRKMEVELKQEDWVGELRGRPTKGPGVVALHHPEWTHNGLLIPANTLDRRIKRRGTRLLIDDGDESGTAVPSFPPAEGFFYWYEGPDGPPGLRFRLASKGTAFVNGQDWVPGGVDGVPWVYPATKAVRHGRLFPWLRADNVLSPAVEASASLALRRSWYKSSLRKAAPHIVHHLLPQNLTEADRMCFSGCTAAIAVSGAEYAMPNIELDRRRVRAGSMGFLYWDGRSLRFRVAPHGVPFEAGCDMRAGHGRWRLTVPQDARAMFAERLIREGLPEHERATVLELAGGTMGFRGQVSSLDPTKLKEDDRLDLDGFKYYEVRLAGVPTNTPGLVLRWGAQMGRQIQAGAQSFPEGTSGFLYLYKQAVGGTMSAELRFRLVPPGTSFWDGRDLERAGKVWRCGLRILCKWQPATMAALADAGHIPRAFYEEARTAVGLSRLHQGFVLEDDYDETGSRPLRWRYPSVIKRLALKDPRAARFRRRGPRVSYQRRVPRYKSPRRLSLMEHKQVSTLDPSKLTDADRVDARDLRGIVLSVPSGAGMEDKPIEVNILAPRTGRFPLDAIGFIYWHDPPNRPPWGGAFRFRVAPPGTAFADGHDLVSPTIGIPYEWGVSELQRDSPGAIAALAAAGRIPRGVAVHAHTSLARGWIRTITNVRDPVIVYFEGRRDIRVLTGDGRAHPLKLPACFQDARFRTNVYTGWALARFEHNPDDPNRLHLRIQKLLSPPVPRFPDYDGFVPPPREGELVMMNTETPWEYVYDRKRPFEDYATALDLFWTEATCRADYVREAGGEEQWKEEWVQPRRRTRGRKKRGR
ncbi:hypothetical protein EV715DRAFT_296532 [Schizophyllum commune]